MGVRGLRSFVREKRDKFLINFKLQDTKLIIDGSNLLYFLQSHYEDENVYGGNYDHFSKRCKDFFKTLLKCNITPIVVFDGADDPDNMKLETIFKRLDEHFKKVNKWQKTEELLPILSKIPLCQILTELSIPHMSCVYEADKEIAVLANKCECPVLSDDSDFYVYNLKNGSISMACMVESERIDPAGRFFLPVKLYRCQRVLKEVFEMENDDYMFPVFATLVGNDIFDPSNLTLTDPKNPYHKLSCAKRNLRAVAEWIRKADFKSGETALDQISRQMPEEERKQFITSVNSYLDIEEFSLFNLEAFLNNNKTGNLEDDSALAVSHSIDTTTYMMVNKGEPLHDNIDSTCETANRQAVLDDNIDITCETAKRQAVLDDNIDITCETANRQAVLDDNIDITSETANRLLPLDDNIASTRETANQLGPLDNNIASTYETVNQLAPLGIASTCETVNQLAPLDDNIASTCETANQLLPLDDNIVSTCETAKQLAPLDGVTNSTCETANQLAPLDDSITSTCETANQLAPLDDTIASTCETTNHLAPLNDKIKKTYMLVPLDDVIISTCETANQQAPLDDNIASTCANQRHPLDDCISSTHVMLNQSKPLHDNSDGTCVATNKLAPLEENIKSACETASQRTRLCNNIESSCDTVKQLAPLNDNTDNKITRTCVKANQCEPSDDTIINTHLTANPRQPLYDNIYSRCETVNHRQALDDNIDNKHAMTDQREPLDTLLDGNNTSECFRNQPVRMIKETSETEHIKLKDRNGNQLPFWFVKNAIDCKMDCTFLLNVTQNHRVIFKAQAEMHEQISSFKCSENIRRVIYRLILDPEKHFKQDQQGKAVKEYHRKWTDCSRVKPIERLECISDLPCLETIPLISEIERKAIVYATFDANPTSLDQEMDETSQILILMLSLWKSNSYATECHLNALVIGILALHIFNPIGSLLCTDILEAIVDTDKDKTDEFKKRMEKHFCKQGYLARRGINKEFIHKVSQFQAIFLHTYHLNQLLLSPVRIPSPGVILNSTFDYSMCHLLENNVEPKNILCSEESSLYRLLGRWKYAIKKQCKLLARNAAVKRER